MSLNVEELAREHPHFEDGLLLLVNRLRRLQHVLRVRALEVVDEFLDRDLERELLVVGDDPPEAVLLRAGQWALEPVVSPVRRRRPPPT